MSRNLKSVNYNDNYDESEDELIQEKPSSLLEELEQRVEQVDPFAMFLSAAPANTFQNQQMNMMQQQQQMLQRMPRRTQQQIPQKIPQNQFLGHDIPTLFQSTPSHKHEEVKVLMQSITIGTIPQNEFVPRLQGLISSNNQKVIPIMPNHTPTNFQIKIEKDQKRPLENTTIPPPKRAKQNSRPLVKPPLSKLATPNPDSTVSTPQTANPPSASVKETDLDLEGMMDVTNYAGVNLKDEENALNEMGAGRVNHLIQAVE
jgi:hypothetical protein